MKCANDVSSASNGVRMVSSSKVRLESGAYVDFFDYHHHHSP
jgi:hypothetical protein